MRVLIVDDEKMVLDYICSSVHWQELGFGQVERAECVAQAQRKILRQKPDILLCDIEMPDGSGLQLMRWAHDQGLRMATIILTGHARFEYAQEAVSLGCMGYLLKPIDHQELMDVLRRAINRVQKAQAPSPASTLGPDALRRRQREFFREMLRPKVQYTPAQLESLAQQKNVRLPVPSLLPVLLHIDDSISTRSMREAQETIIHLALESLPACLCDPLLADNEIVLIFPEKDPSALLPLLQRWIHQVKALCGEEVTAIIGEICTLSVLYKQYDMLCYAIRHAVLSCHAIALQDACLPRAPYTSMDAEICQHLLINHAYDQLLDEIDKHINEQFEQGALSSYALSRFYQELVQQLSLYLQRTGLPLSLLSEDEIAAQLSANAMRSISALHAWAALVFKRLQKITPVTEALSKRPQQMEDDPISVVKHYIQSHLYENISRTELAAVVSLSPEHLSRMFHKREGITLQRYLQTRKMEEAKKLLRETSQSVSEIAQQLGMDNFAYFSQVFKKSTGYLPLQYRARTQSTK